MFAEGIAYCTCVFYDPVCVLSTISKFHVHLRGERVKGKGEETGKRRSEKVERREGEWRKNSAKMQHFSLMGDVLAAVVQ